MNNDRILITIGKNIKYLRLTKGWSQERLAFECNIDRSFLGKIERGTVNVSILTLCDIVKPFGINVKELL